MKTLRFCMLAAMIVLGMPTLAPARVTRHVRPEIVGEVTAAQTTTITVTEAKHGGRIETVDVPSGTPIKAANGGSAPALSSLVGKHVMVKERSPGIASEIIVRTPKSGKKSNSASL